MIKISTKWLFLPFECERIKQSKRIFSKYFLKKSELFLLRDNYKIESNIDWNIIVYIYS